VYNSLKFFKENSLKEHEELIEQYFTTDINTNLTDGASDGSNTVELVPGGSRVRVTDVNKSDFIIKKCHFIGYKCVSDQLQSLQEGFYKVIPQHWISVLNTDELEAAICGNQHIDLEDWKENTELKGYGKWS
jgi:hypothetical protein